MAPYRKQEGNMVGCDEQAILSPIPVHRRAPGLLCDRRTRVMRLKFKFQVAGNFSPKHCDVAETRFQQIAPRWSDSGNLRKFQPEDSCAMVRFWKLAEVSARRFQHGWKLPEVSGRRFQLEVRFWKLPQDSGS